VDAVCVKKLTLDRSKQSAAISEMYQFSNTFRIYGKTKFTDLKKAACDYWNFKE
jgi:hypothetical protein